MKNEIRTVFAKAFPGIESRETSSNVIYQQQPEPVAVLKKHVAAPKKQEPKKKSPVSAKLIEKGFIEEDYSKKIMYDFITVKSIITNHGEKNIRALDGFTIFKDILGNRILVSGFRFMDSIPANSEVEYNFQIKFNYLKEDHVALKNEKVENLVLVIEAKKILYSDGTEEVFKKGMIKVDLE
jgi:hypothetical protein